jgi:copper resistance protein B
MKMLLLASLPLVSLAAEHDHGAATVVAEPPASAVDHSAHLGAANVADSVIVAAHTAMMEHGGMMNWFAIAERLERQQQDGKDLTLWDAQGWFGGDYHRLWLKTEGEWLYDTSGVGHSELQLLYSRAVAPFWDLQAGLRHDEGMLATRTYAVFGVQGLAPYWFEVDMAAFVSEEAGLQLRLEAEYDLRLTQKLLLQPRLQFNHAFDDDVAAGIEQGVADSNVALRLRYEISREFAPYVGIERDFGGHRQPDETRLVAGLRLWW